MRNGKEYYYYNCNCNKNKRFGNSEGENYEIVIRIRKPVIIVKLRIAFPCYQCLVTSLLYYFI